MKNFPIEHEGRIYWISRAVAVVGFIFTVDNGLRVLANKRGKDCPDYQGYWNCPCGYLDFDETAKEACCREIAEETNLYVSPKDLHLYGINDDPHVEHQNITFRYWAFNVDSYKGQTIYAKGKEQDEVEDVEWIAIEDLDKYKFAFGQKDIIKEIVSTYFSSMFEIQN